MNLKEIKEIISLMNENDLAEIEIERDGLKLKLKKSGLEQSLMVPAAPVPYSLERIPSPTTTQEPVASGDTAKKGGAEIKSPMVGTFYRAASPETPPFVEVGQTVEVGQVVCIVEAMKLMNEIKSEVRGKIKEIVVENAEPVEFGQTLFVVEPL